VMVALPTWPNPMEAAAIKIPTSCNDQLVRMRQPS
jgi:hypothetical protein